jgi:cytochrome c oxidase subunit 3
VTSHGDPTPPGKIAIWFFLASEIMFFIAILGTYIVLRSGSPHLFSQHAAILSKTLAGTNTIVLILSSVTMYIAVDAAHKGKRNRVMLGLLITFLCACAFMGIKYVEYRDKFTHHTITARESANSPVMVYDGHVHEENGQRVLTGYRIAMPPNFNINLISEADVHHSAAAAAGKKPEELAPEKYVLPATINQDITYGPWKNVFYASYFTATGIHGVHVIGGMVPIAILLVYALRGRLLPAHTEYIGLYWHFVDLVWIFLFPLLYLI